MSVVSTGGAVASAEALLRHLERDVKMSQDMMPYGWPDNRMPKISQLNVVRGGAVAKAWRSEGRQTLAIHPEVQRETSKASSSRFPMEMLRAIPYINPMVIYAEPPVVESWRKGIGAQRWMNYADEHDMRLIGFMVTGKRGVLDPLGPTPFPTVLQACIDEVVSSHDPDAESLALLCYFDVYDSAGKKIDAEVATLSVPLTGDYTIKELVEDQAMRFAFLNGDGGLDTNLEQRKRWFMEVYKIVMGSLLYLCSTVLDAEKVPTIATKHLAKTIARKPLSLYRVGWTLGAALTKYRQARAKGPGSQMGDIAHQQDPQHRKCHFRMQWYGPRSAHPCQLMRGTCDCDGRHREWIFIAAYWTHRERMGRVGVNTVRKVPKVV